MKKFSLPIIVSLIILLFNSCKREVFTSQPVIIVEKKLKITGISPTSGKPGSVLTITGTGFDSTYYKNTIFFNKGISSGDSGSAGKLFTTVPFYAETGNIKVLAMNDSANGPVFNVTPIYKYGLNIIRYTGPTLTESQSYYYVDCKADTIKWTGQINGDSLILSIGGCSGDESVVKFILKFSYNANEVMPHFGLGLYMYSDYSPYNFTTDTLKGFAAIQDWNITDIVSGKVTVYDSVYYRWWSFVFWYKFK